MIWLSVAYAGECDPGDAVRNALQEWLGGDRASGRIALDAAARTFGCSGPAEAQTLARYWILEGVVLTAEGDPEAASESFAAARRVAPDMWLPDLAPELRTAWSRATDPAGSGTIVLDPAPGNRPVWVDGERLSGDEVPAGLHLVQVSEPGQDVAEFSSMVWIGPGVAAMLETGLSPARAPRPTPVRPPPAPRPASDVRFELQGLVGTGTAIGSELTAGDLREPAVKVAIPVELGVGVAAPGAFGQVRVGAAALVGGRYLASTSGGRIAPPFRLDVGAAGGIGDDLRFGLAAGAQWPSRLAGRLLVGWSPMEPVYGELRAGANLPTERSPEPAFDLVVGFRL